MALPVHHLVRLIASHEQWLLRRLLCYAQADGYPSHASLEEAWRASVAGLSDALIGAVEGEKLSGTGLHDAPAPDPWLAVGVSEGRSHGLSWITLATFLGRFKYYRQSYLDLVCETGFHLRQERRYLAIVNRFFDRVEDACCAEWTEAAEWGISCTAPRHANRRGIRYRGQQVIVLDGLAYRGLVVTSSITQV